MPCASKQNILIFRFSFIVQKHEPCDIATEHEIPATDADIVISDDEDEIEEFDEISEQHNFMAYFNLVNQNASELPRRNISVQERSISPKKKRPVAQRTRKVIQKKEKDLEMAIPFSSPAGIFLTRKSILSEDDKLMAAADLNEMCPAKPTLRFPRMKQRLNIGSDTNAMKEMRKPRVFYWPKRVLHSRSRLVNFEFLNRSLIDTMKPCGIVLRQITESDIKAVREELAMKHNEKKLLMAGDCVDLCSDSDSDSVALDENVSMPQVNENSYHGNYYAMPGPPMGFLPTRIPPFSQLSPTLPSNVMFFNRSQSFTSSITNNGIYPQFSITTTESTTTNIVNRMDQSSEESVTSTRSKRSIQQWLKNVNGESSCYSSQVSVANTN